jgi:beta-lactam-binding protein with PASTA domain
VPSVVQTPASWTMPNLVGAGLQDAQDAIQELTGFAIMITTSHDATGQNRVQISDRNWKVCTQNVAPGATITRDTRIDFGAVKLEESC